MQEVERDWRKLILLGADWRPVDLFVDDVLEDLLRAVVVERETTSDKFKSDDACELGLLNLTECPPVNSFCVLTPKNYLRRNVVWCTEYAFPLFLLARWLIYQYMNSYHSSHFWVL